MLLMARSADDLQALLFLINVLAMKIQLKFNPKKCVTLHYSNKAPAALPFSTWLGPDRFFGEWMPNSVPWKADRYVLVS